MEIPARYTAIHLKSPASPAYRGIFPDLGTHSPVEPETGAYNHNQRLELLGQLTGGVAHDFNNHLGTIMGNLSLLEDENSLDEPSRQRLQRALRATARASALTRRLLAFARRQPLQAEAVPVDALVEEMRDLIEYSAGPLVTLKLALRAPGVHVHVDRGQLENALLNLVINSAAAMPEGGVLTIGTQVLALPATGEAGVEITVEDTGTGIPDDVLPRVFEPFFTTKPVTEGSGLGLSIVYGFVRQSGGQVAIRSQCGSGTCVTLQFPVLASATIVSLASVATRKADPAEEPRLPPCRVLLVDDDEALRTTVTDMLKEGRVSVATATSAETALRMLEAAPGSFDAVLADLRLGGGLDGLRLCKAARERWPGLHVTLMSGLSPEMFTRSPEAAEWPQGLPFLQKPFDRGTLRAWVRGLAPAPACRPR